MMPAVQTHKRGRAAERQFLPAILAMIWALVFVQIIHAAALPEGATVSVENSTRRTPAAATSVNAIAGNVSQLSIVGTTSTQSWQGFYGNVSGTITLDDAANKTLYDWALASPAGEVFAVRAGNTPSWTADNIMCYNFSMNSTYENNYFTFEELESLMNIDSADVDGVNETFIGQQYSGRFYAGYSEINGTTQDCNKINLYVNDMSQSENFTEVLLYDLNGGTPSEADSGFEIFAAIIEENGAIGFDNLVWDFQMLVLEDGHEGDSATTEYYFYVELE